MSEGGAMVTYVWGRSYGHLCLREELWSPMSEGGAIVTYVWGRSYGHLCLREELRSPMSEGGAMVTYVWGRRIYCHTKHLPLNNLVERWTSRGLNWHIKDTWPFPPGDARRYNISTIYWMLALLRAASFHTLLTLYLWAIL